ncbi:NDR1/HIN1-like protein 10 [Papaver somniferum]|uniref:NDR1/HIN1-like protein 10 n=1 Tax=Papaver somniferum TaxID=3469 RepID=UPI000E6FECF7|nr:NDR1/HIN1-like protein 10 [Papaver somniferum]
MKFHVTDASLKEFYVTNDDILHYKFAVNISVRNSNKLERISYRNIRIYPYCYGNYLPWVSLTAFWQGTKNTTLLPLVLFQGQSPVKLRGSNLKNFNNDQRDGSYNIYVVMYLTTQLKHAGGAKSGKRDFIVQCELFQLHLLDSSANNQTGNGGLFRTKKCNVYNDNDSQTY